MKAPDYLPIEVSAERIEGEPLPGPALCDAICDAIRTATGEDVAEVDAFRRSERSGAVIVRWPDKASKPASLLGPASDGERGETLCYELPSEVCEWLATWPVPASSPVRFILGEALPGDHPLVAWLIATRVLDECEI